MNHSLTFSKMHGLGNDFIIVDSTTTIKPLHFDKSFIQALAHRYTGIGFDQMLVIKTSNIADFACEIFNADGSEAEQCGNGMRCVARFIHEKKLAEKKSFSISTLAGKIQIVIHNYDAIEVDMGQPKLEHKQINLDLDSINLTTVSMGNPHALLFVDSLQNYPVAELGKTISAHSFFPHGTNVGFIEVLDRQHIRLQTFERGAGNTFACGSNACAAVVAGIWNELLDNKVTVELALGSLSISWQGIHHSVFMTGPATWVFDGVL